MRTPKTRLGREPLQADRASVREQIPEARAERDACEAVTTLYQMHYRSLVRLAALLVSDLATAEDIVQDSFAAVHGTWQAPPVGGPSFPVSVAAPASRGHERT